MNDMQSFALGITSSGHLMIDEVHCHPDNSDIFEIMIFMDIGIERSDSCLHL